LTTADYKKYKSFFAKKHQATHGSQHVNSIIMNTAFKIKNSVVLLICSINAKGKNNYKIKAKKRQVHLSIYKRVTKVLPPL
jgi:hypothetical protein